MTEQAPASGAVADETADLRSRVLRNTGAQMIGRMVIALSRLAVAAIVVRGLGAGTFGEYALILSLLAVAEWIVDFGTTEIFVREVCREPARERPLLRIVTALKLVQVPIALVALAALILIMRYPQHVLLAGLVGGASLVFYAGVLVFRVIFKAHLTLEREVAAELGSVLVLILLVVGTASIGGGLIALMACYVISRLVFLALCIPLGRRRFTLSIEGVRRSDMRWGASISMTVGVIGLLVAVYEMLDILILSKLGTAVEMGYYSGAQRLVWPLLLALGSVGGTLYPIAARHWPSERARFAEACQRGVDAVVVIAGIALSSTLAAAEFFLGLLGPELAAGAPALRILSLLVLVKAVSSTLGPVVYVVHGQRNALRWVCLAVVMKAIVIAALAGPFGYVGVAVGALAVELCFGIAPTVFLLRLHGDLRLNWMVAAKVAMAIAVAAACTSWLLPGTSIMAAMLAPIVYVALVTATGALRVSDLGLLASRGAR
jgi:O-antigen/teichoic acid export membrane protein